MTTMSDTTLRQAAQQGMDTFLAAIIDAIKNDIGGDLSAQNMQLLNSEQITLLGWQLLHDEVMDGGFIQLIQNHLGPFIFHNPLAKALRLWGMKDLSKLIYQARELYDLVGQELERERSDEEFMALFEQYPEFDDLDDSFVENEELWTAQIATYVDEHLDHFITVSG
ncbi:MAG: DMP19 family protein [Prevotella sp.]|nr:DMP19 family protein [Prevotella sp.]